jgi:hypothetical protein
MTLAEHTQHARLVLASVEYRAVVAALKDSGTLDRAACSLGITRQSLLRLITKHAIKYSYGNVR